MSERQKKVVIVVLCIAAVLLLAGIASMFALEKYKVKTQEDVPAEVSVSAEATATPTPTEDPHKGKVQSTLNGKWVKQSVENKRPFAVMINNIEYAFEHQSGVSKADIVYEALAEGGITRMMAIYQDVSNVKRIGSVRSARHYYVQFAYEWDAIFCHFGQTKYAIAKMNHLGTNNLSGLSAIGSVVYARDYSIAAPHNVFTNGKKMKKGAKKLGYSLKKDESKQAEHFKFYETNTEPESDVSAKKITIPFSNYSTCVMKYNKKKKKYMKYEYGKKHMDQYYKKQLSFDNVIIQLVEESNKDHNGYQTMELSNNTGKGYYFSDGKQINITWERKGSGSSITMVYRDESGDTLTVNPGKTYIGVYPKSRKKLIQVK
jgi:hypothetical protein